MLKVTKDFISTIVKNKCFFSWMKTKIGFLATLFSFCNSFSDFGDYVNTI